MWDHFSSLLNFSDNNIHIADNSQRAESKKSLRTGKYIRQVKELLVLFPDCDPLYLEYCCQFYQDNHVERICEKIFQVNHSHYPKIPKNLVLQPRCPASRNVYLENLSEMFPDCDPTYLREVISSCSHSVVYKSVNHLIEKSGKYPTRAHFGRLDNLDFFRSEPYKKGAFFRLMNLFPKVPKSSVKAILAETNYNFINSYDLLSQLTLQNTWVNSILSYLNSRKSYDDPSMYTLELLQDLNALENRGKKDTLDKDLALAQKMNQEQYDNENQSILCGCCYLQYTFEDLTQCDEGHLFCRDCLNRYVSEAIHGQSNFKEKGYISCIDTSGCLAKFSDRELSRGLEPDIFSNFQNTMFESDLERSSLSLVRCPFCKYVEVDQDPTLRKIRWSSYFIFSSVLAMLRILNVVFGGLSKFSFPLDVLLIVLTIVAISEFSSFNIVEYFSVSMIPQSLLVSSTCNILQCKAPECGKMSCRTCFQQCLPSHQCMENEKDSLRLKIEQAMADAVKRTCPDCNLSFMKLDGCNKMTCRCGYVMCYLCREGIKDISYSHFCEHFRFNPGEPCRQCNKCDLYKDPNDELAMANAARRAKKEFLLEHPELKPRLGKRSGSKSRLKTPSPEFVEETPQEYIANFSRFVQNSIFDWFFE